MRLALPADEQFAYLESGLCRDLFDCGQLPVTAEGHRSRVIVATHQGTTSPVGAARDGTIYELFFTGLPALGFTAADVTKLYLHRGSFETELADEDREQDSDRWCSFTTHGQEVWQILSQWMWNFRQELSQQWQPTQIRLTVFAEAQTEASPSSAHVVSAPISQPSREAPAFGPPQWARPARVGSLERALCASTQWHAALSTRATLPADAVPNTMALARALFSPHCRLSRLSYACTVSRTWCLHQKTRRVSAVLYPLPQPAHQDRPPSPSLHEDHPPPCPSACHPLLWGDWPRCQPRRAWMQWLRRHLVIVNAPPVTSPPSTPSLLSRAERAHWRLNWLQRFTRNARRSPPHRSNDHSMDSPPNSPRSSVCESLEPGGCSALSSPR